MEEQDHAYINTSEDKATTVELFHKMSAKEVEDFVKLRVTNSHLFSGKRNTSMWAWRAILKHMGLHHKMTHNQAKKKWENLKKRYKDLKYPPEGVQVFPATWSHFSLMDDAMEGRLLNSAPVLNALNGEQDSSDFLPATKPKKRKLSSTMLPSSSVADGPEIEFSLSGEEEQKEMAETVDKATVMGFHLEEDEEEEETETLDSKPGRQMMVMERERLVLQREKAVRDREIAVLERDRALLERERAVMEREKALMERERVMVAKDRDDVCRQRLALQQEKATMERLSAYRTRNEDVMENGSELLDASNAVDVKERFFSLFENLLDKLEK